MNSKEWKINNPVDTWRKTASLLGQNDATTLFWRNSDAIITSNTHCEAICQKADATMIPILTRGGEEWALTQMKEQQMYTQYSTNCWKPS